MADTDIYSDKQILAGSAWAEARSLGKPGMQATLNTIQNRKNSGVRWWGSELREIALHPWQYSCWNERDINRFKIFDALKAPDHEMLLALDLAELALDNKLPDKTSGADSYYDCRIHKPEWAKFLMPVYEIYPHWYFVTTLHNNGSDAF